MEMIFHSNGNTSPSLQERLPIPLNLKKKAFLQLKKNLLFIDN